MTEFSSIGGGDYGGRASSNQIAFFGKSTILYLFDYFWLFGFREIVWQSRDGTMQMVLSEKGALPNLSFSFVNFVLLSLEAGPTHFNFILHGST